MTLVPKHWVSPPRRCWIVLAEERVEVDVHTGSQWDQTKIVVMAVNSTGRKRVRPFPDDLDKLGIGERRFPPFFFLFTCGQLLDEIDQNDGIVHYNTRK